MHSVLERTPATLGEANCWRASTRSTPTRPSTASWCRCRCPGTSTRRRSSSHRTREGRRRLLGASAGALMAGLPGLRPCTPYGCMKLIESTGVNLQGQACGGDRTQQHRGQADGPAAAAGQRHRHRLPQRHARHRPHTRQADIVVAAGGPAATSLTADMVKPGAVVIDVGINRNERRQAVRRRRLRRRARGGRLDHPGAGWRRPDDHHHAAGQHAGGGRAARWKPDRCEPAAVPNPLRSAASAGLRGHPARTRDARARRAAGRGRGRARSASPCGGAGRLRRVVEKVLDVAGRARCARLGRSATSRGGRHARAARGLQRQPAGASPSFRPGWAPTSGCTPSTRPWPHSPTAARRGAAQARWPTPARLRALGGRTARRGDKRALRRHPGPCAELARPSASMCSTPPTPSRSACPGAAGRRAGRRGPGRPLSAQADGAKATS
jgi:hypothetical protein